MSKRFRDPWLEQFYQSGQHHKRIPKALHNALSRKLDLLIHATDERDLRRPPGNRLEQLKGELARWYSIRVNQQYRLIFVWNAKLKRADWIYLDSHRYKG